MPQPSLVFPPAVVPWVREGSSLQQLQQEHQASPGPDRAFRQRLHTLLKHNLKRQQLSPPPPVSGYAQQQEKTHAATKYWTRDTGIYKRRNIGCFGALWWSTFYINFDQQLQAERADLNVFTVTALYLIKIYYIYMTVTVGLRSNISLFVTIQILNIKLSDQERRPNK